MFSERRHIHPLWQLLTVPVCLVTAYVGCAVILSIIPVNSDYRETPEGIPMYVTTNGVHTDIVLPARHPLKDWSNEFDHVGIRNLHSAQWLAFGWGHKEFYVETPQWEDLKLGTALRSLSYVGGTAMHVVVLRREPRPAEDSKRLLVSSAQYASLCKYIEGSFDRDEKGRLRKVPVHGYSDNDMFFDARGKYGFLYTSNNWVGSALEAAGIRTSLWSPFDHGILFHL